MLTVKQKSGFSKEQNAFTEDSGGGQTEETKSPGTITAAGTLTTQAKKGADTARR